MDPQAVANFIKPIYDLLVTQILPGLLGAVLAIIGGSLVLRFAVRLARMAATRARIKPALVDLIGGAVTVAGWIIIIASMLQSLGLNQIALAVGSSLSVATLGITLALSGNLGDIISGLFLASDPDFEIGFTITTGTLTGVIERLDLRKTRIRTPDGKLHVVPNKSIESEKWIVEQRIAPPPPININLPNIPHLPGRGRRSSQQEPGSPPVPPSSAPT